MTAVAKDDGQALIERIQAGEPDAFGELYARYRAPIFRFLYFSPDGSREGNPEAAVVEKLRDTALIKALWLLSADQRDCLIHRYVLGLSLAETAALMGRNESAIKALAFRATQAMARYLGEEVWR